MPTLEKIVERTTIHTEIRMGGIDAEIKEMRESIKL